MAEQSSTQPAGAVNPEPAKPERRRIDSIDLLRGIVMVIMMLDHTRDFMHADFLRGLQPEDLATTTPLVFFTRWITHFCAPVFVFLAGTGAYLQLARGKSKRDLSKFLVSRGLWLILLELTIVKLGMWFNPAFSLLAMLQVIWVLGVSMIVLAALIHLPIRVIVGFGLLMIAFHNLLDRFQVPGWNGPGSPVPAFGQKLWAILHQGFMFFPIFGEGMPVVAVIYPLIPWIGVMAVGYAFGVFYTKGARERQRWLLIIGGICALLFFAVRAVNIYGDPSRWASQTSSLFTVLSFLNTTKYPPSLLFLLMTLGPSIFVLAFFETLPHVVESGKFAFGRLRSALVTFGRVPLFFYLLQWYASHLIAVIIGLLAGQPVAWQFAGPETRFTSVPPGVGFRLWVVYLCWIVGVLLLYPLCKWFAGVKARRRDWWLSYL